MNEAGDIICSPRHRDQTMRKQIEQSKADWSKEKTTQGFVDQWGVFLTREEALYVAKRADQIIYRCGGDEYKLFSDNLY